MTDKIEREKNAKIFITHVNIRQSLSLLVIKLIIIEVIVTTLFLVTCNTFTCYSSGLLAVYAIICSCAQLILTVMVVSKWMHEYYEISSTGVTHRNGFLRHDKDESKFAHLTAISIEQSFLGQLLNFGTIHLFNKETKEEFYLYQIHNPVKYYQLILNIDPGLDEEKRQFNQKIIRTPESI